MMAALINATHLAAQVQVMLEMRDQHGKLLSTGYSVTIPRRCLEHTTINGKLKYSYFPLIQHVIKRKKVKS